MAKLYTELAEWWPLLSAPADYAEEAEVYWETIQRSAQRPVETMLELGCGGGNTASFLKQHCSLTLTDLSEAMLNVSQSANPECEHVQGDMRSLRLGRSFDAVFVHDAVMSMTSESDLKSAMVTAFEHCRPGGVVLFVPDCTSETFEPDTSQGGHDGEGKALRYLEWRFDPDPTDTQFVSQMVYVLRENGVVTRIESDRHDYGLFSRTKWLTLLDAAGLMATHEPAGYDECGVQSYGELFIAVRPLQ